MTSRRIPASLLLPVLVLALWVMIVAVPITLSYVSLQQAAHGAPTVNITTPFRYDSVPRSHFFSYAADRSTARFGKAMTALNLPAATIDIPMSRLTPSWPMDWTPAGLNWEAWRAISYPLYCLPFWWFGGVGLDGLLKRRRLRWPTCLIGTLFFAFFLFIALGLTFGLPAKDHEDMPYIILGLWFWVLFYISLPATWIMQWRSSRKLKRQASTTEAQE